MQPFSLSLAELTRFSAAIRQLGEQADSLESVAQRTASFLHRSLVDPNTGKTACALVRCFATERLQNLPSSLREVARRGTKGALEPDTRCLVLLGTAGDREAWNDRRASRGHQVIPFASREAVERMPMVRELFVRLGVGTAELVGESLLLGDAEEPDFDVLFVPEARGSPFIPAQAEFVEPYGVRSTVGFGCQIPSGEVLAAICFSKVPLEPASAPLFRNLAIAIKVAAVSGGYARVFEAPNASRNGLEEDALAAPIREFDLRHLHSLSRAQRALLEIHESTVEEQARRLEATLSDVRRAREELQERVIELAAHQRELEQRNEELDQFTYAASHDLQEPLRKLVAYSELLQMDAGDRLSEEARTDLGFIVDAASRMMTLVQDLLALSRASRMAIEPREVDLDACISEVLDSLSLALEEAEAQILRDPVPHRVWAEPTLLKQVYQNLLQNAIKFRAPDRRATIHLTCSTESDGRVLLGVRDNGIGVPDPYRTQIFAPFRRLHLRSQIEGSGIGLAVCRRALERLGGEIGVDSEEGVGSHFWFRLPTTSHIEEEKDRRPT